jgi:hypothetical protein
MLDVMKLIVLMLWLMVVVVVVVGWKAEVGV